MSHLYCVFRPPTVISLIFAGEQRPQKKGKCYFGLWVKNINGEEALLRWRWRIIWTWIAVIKPIRTVTREHAELFSEHKAARSVFCKNSLLIGLCYLLFTQTSSLDIQVFNREREKKHSSDTQSSSFHIWRTLLKGQSTPVMQWYHQLYNHTILAKEGVMS